MVRLKPANLSLAAQLAIVLVAVVVFSTAVVATVAYDAARRTMRDEAAQNVMAVADARKELFRTSLRRHSEKASGIVKNIELGCGISGRMNRICARETLEEFVSDEDARGARLTYGRGRQVVAGDFAATADGLQDMPAFLAFDAAGQPMYAVRTADPDSGGTVDVEFPAEELQRLFASERSSRQVVRVTLVTAEGKDLLAGGGKPSLQASVVTACLAGNDGQRIGPDEHNVVSLQAYRFLPQVNGCVLAQISTAEVFAPALRLRSRLVALSLAFAVFATSLALWLARLLARPISRLRQRVHSLEKGDFDSPVPPGESTEVQELADAFQSMATSLNQSRQALIQSEGRLKLTYRAARLWPWEYDVVTAEIRWTDPTGGRTLRETVRSFIARVHPDDRPAVQAAMQRAKQQGDYDVEYRVVLPSKEIVWVAGRGQVMYDNAGRAVLLVGVNLDITARKQAEQALLERERFVATGQMAASLAHEINNPLASVTSALYLLRSRLVADPDKRFLAIAAEQTDRIARIAKQLLNLYVGTPAAPPVSVTEIWARIIKEQGQLAGERGIALHTDLRGTARVHAFGPELRNAFTNLLLNSVQALQSEGSIYLRVRRGRRWQTDELGVIVTLADNGPGIPPEQRQEIFRPFVGTREEPGSGLGLWVTESVIRGLGGCVRLRSSTRPGRSGTCICLFLPEQPRTERRTATRPPLPIPSEPRPGEQAS